LGAIPSLFGKPTEYARFLGTELSMTYVGPLLIVMPEGYGIYDGGRSTAAEQAVLSKLAVDGSTKDALVASAAKAAGGLGGGAAGRFAGVALERHPRPVHVHPAADRQAGEGNAASLPRRRRQPPLARDDPRSKRRRQDAQDRQDAHARRVLEPAPRGEVDAA